MIQMLVVENRFLKINFKITVFEEHFFLKSIFWRSLLAWAYFFMFVWRAYFFQSNPFIVLLCCSCFGENSFEAALSIFLFCALVLFYYLFWNLGHERPSELWHLVRYKLSCFMRAMNFRNCLCSCWTTIEIRPKSALEVNVLVVFTALALKIKK